MIRHVAARPDLIHRRFKVFVDLRVFVFEFNLAAAELHARERAAFAVLRAHELVAPVVPAKRQVARRRRAGIEMLMEPLIRRHDHAARPPIDALRRFTRGPENRIALTGKNDDMRAGAVLVPFLVRAHGELGDMRAHGVFGQVEFHVRAALAALAVIGELERVRVGHKVRR